MLGQYIQHIWPEAAADESTFSILGAASMLAGTTRLTLYAPRRRSLSPNGLGRHSPQRVRSLLLPPFTQVAGGHSHRGHQQYASPLLSANIFLKMLEHVELNDGWRVADAGYTLPIMFVAMIARLVGYLFISTFPSTAREHLGNSNNNNNFYSP